MLTNRMLGRHATRILMGAVFCLLVFHFFYRTSPNPIQHGNTNSGIKPTTNTPGVDNGGEKDVTGQDEANLKSIRDYTAFFENLEAYMPKCPSLKDVYKTEKAPEVKSDNNDFLFSKSLLENVLDIPDSTFKEL